MKITPLDIRQKTFENKFRGYDKDEVQAFLNSLSHEWERVQDDYKEMKIKYEGIQKEVEKLRQVENSLYKTLKTAEDTGASLIDQANRTAELQMKEAQIKADDTIKKAKEKAKFIVENAERNSKSILEEMKDAIKSVETDFHRIESLKENLLLELKNLSQDTLDKIDRYKSQKNKFDFEEHLKKAKSFARLNKDYSYYTFAPDDDENPSSQEPKTSDQHEQYGAQTLEQDMIENIPIESTREETATLPLENQVEQKEDQEEEVEPAREEKGKNRNRSFFDELE